MPVDQCFSVVSIPPYPFQMSCFPKTCNTLSDLQSYPEFCRATFDLAPDNFLTICSELEKAYGIVSHIQAVAQLVLLHTQPAAATCDKGCRVMLSHVYDMLNGV